MQEQPLQAAEHGRRPGQQFAGVDLRRPKGYVAPSPPAPAPAAAAAAAAGAGEGEPCPRCESRDTKFCYYNNYNTSQPRHFCKCCRRYWTKGGTLRNVPVGGGTRKKSSSSSSSSPSSPSPSPATAAKRQKPSKKRRVEAPPEERPATPVDVVAVPDSAKTTETTTTPQTDAASGITAELVVPATEDQNSFTDLLQSDDDTAVALGLGFSDYPAGGKALLDPDSFEWPPAFDLGAYWSGAGFADPDPGVFLNLP